MRRLRGALTGAVLMVALAAPALADPAFPLPSDGPITPDTIPALRAQANRFATPQPVDGPLAPLALLADTRASSRWPAIVDRIGISLAQFEAFLVTRADAMRAALADGSVPRTGLVSSRANRTQWVGLDPQIEVRLQLARTLAVFDLEAAIAELTAVEADPSIGNGDGGSRVHVFIRHATMLASHGRDAQALAVLAHASTLFPPHSDSGINVDVNAAAIEVERGQPQAALALLDRAGDPYAHRMADRTSAVIASGAVQYRWIRACAYQQLGRTGEAASLMRALVANPIASPPIRERAALCVGDADMLATALADAMRAGPSEDALLLQPARIVAANPRRHALLTAVRDRPEIAALHAATQRDLPDAYAPILAQEESHLR